MMDNEKRADLGVAAVRAAASVTNVWRVESAEVSIRDVLSYIAHACDRLELDPAVVFSDGLESYHGDSEDGPGARALFDGAGQSFASMKVWGE